MIDFTVEVIPSESRVDLFYKNGEFSIWGDEGRDIIARGKSVSQAEGCSLEQGVATVLLEDRARSTP